MDDHCRALILLMSRVTVSFVSLKFSNFKSGETKRENALLKSRQRLLEEGSLGVRDTVAETVLVRRGAVAVRGDCVVINTEEERASRRCVLAFDPVPSR